MSVSPWAEVWLSWAGTFPTPETIFVSQGTPQAGASHPCRTGSGEGPVSAPSSPLCCDKAAPPYGPLTLDGGCKELGEGKSQASNKHKPPQGLNPIPSHRFGTRSERYFPQLHHWASKPTTSAWVTNDTCGSQRTQQP